MNNDDCLTATDLAELAAIERTSDGSPPATLPYKPELDWSGISAAAMSDVRDAAERIRARHGSIIDKILETGADLLRIKDMLGHGRFGPWLAAEFGWTDRTAGHYMSVAREFGHQPEVARLLQPSALYALAAKSTPLSLREEIIAEAKTGKAAEAADVKRRVAQVRDAERSKSGTSRGTRVPGSPITPAETVTASIPRYGARPDGQLLPEASGMETLADTPTVKNDSTSSCETIDADRRLKESQAAEYVLALQKKLGKRFEGFRKVVRRFSTPLYMDALNAAPPIASTDEGSVVDLPPEDFSRATP